MSSIPLTILSLIVLSALSVLTIQVYWLQQLMTSSRRSRYHRTYQSEMDRVVPLTANYLQNQQKWAQQILKSFHQRSALDSILRSHLQSQKMPSSQVLSQETISALQNFQLPRR
jgi:cell division protein FtsL